MQAISYQDYRELCERARKKGSKYRNIPREVDGHVFASGKEAERYAELKLLERCGAIKNLELQKRFEIVPQSVYGKARYYVADFVYEQDGKNVVEDVKGFKTQSYSLKKRLMKEVHGIEIKEI